MTAVEPALDRVREVAPAGTRYFEPYRPAYETLLTELDALGGDPATNRLVSWVVDRTRGNGDQ
jgi:hypothetical protein